MCERELDTEQNCNILTPTLMAISVVSFSFSWVAQPEARWPSFSGCWFSLPHLISNSSGLQLSRRSRGPLLLGAGFLYRILSPTGLVSKLTDFLSSPSHIIVPLPPSSCGRHKLHSFNPSTIKVIISWSTGCTCYLDRCISYFDSPAGS